MAGNDQIAFYSAVPGYYPPTGLQSPVSLVAYRINSNSNSSSYNKMERMGKGLIWNGIACGATPCTSGCFYAAHDRCIGSITFRDLAGCDDQFDV